MTCYDCIHCEPCSDAGDAGFSSLKEDVSKCKHFKNRADFVEVEKVVEMLIEQCCDYPCNLNDNAEWLCLIDCDCKCSMKCWEKFVRHYGERK